MIMALCTGHCNTSLCVPANLIVVLYSDPTRLGSGYNTYLIAAMVAACLSVNMQEVISPTS